MRKLIILAALAGTLAACGGGGSGSGGSGGSSSATPAVSVLSSAISRIAVSGTSITVGVSIRPNFTPAGTFTVTASDQENVFNPAVTVQANADGSYLLTLHTSTKITESNFASNVTLNLCSDTACATPQKVASITVPFNIDVLSPTSNWPGNNVTALAVWPGVADWSTFQGNAAHTGLVPVTLDPNLFTLRWETLWDSGRLQDYDLNETLTVANGQLFQVAGNVLYARKEFDGTPTWAYDFSALAPFAGEGFVYPPAAANGKVYLAAGAQQNTYMFGLDAASGAVSFKAQMSSQWPNYLAPTVWNGNIYADGGSYDGLYGFSPTGQQLFFATAGQTELWSPAVDATGVYTYTYLGLRVVDPVSGAVLHTITDPTFTNYIYELGGSPVLGAPGSVIVANYANWQLNSGGIGNTLVDFNTAKNNIAWQVAGNYPTTPAYANGTIYAANDDPVQLEARNEADGSLKWSWTPPAAGDLHFVSEVLLTNNLAFVSTNLSTYAIDLMTHQTVWSYPLSARLALSQNGILYLQSHSYLVAINLK